MNKKLSRYPPRQPPNTMRVSKYETFSLRIPNGLTALQITRWLLTKFYRSGRKYTEEESNICYLLSEYWNSYRNKGFFQKHQLELLKLRSLMRLSLVSRELTQPEKVSEKLILSQRCLYSPRAFLSLPSDYAQKFLSVRNRKLNARPPEPRRIGVGYRDKGTAQDESIDGSPSWATVASHPLYRNKFSDEVEWWQVTKFLLPQPPKSKV